MSGSVGARRAQVAGLPDHRQFRLHFRIASGHLPTEYAGGEVIVNGVLRVDFAQKAHVLLLITAGVSVEDSCRRALARCASRCRTMRCRNEPRLTSRSNTLRILGSSRSLTRRSSVRLSGPPAVVKNQVRPRSTPPRSPSRTTGGLLTCGRPPGRRRRRTRRDGPRDRARRPCRSRAPTRSRSRPGCAAGARPSGAGSQ